MKVRCAGSDHSRSRWENQPVGKTSAGPLPHVAKAIRRPSTSRNRMRCSMRAHPTEGRTSLDDLHAGDRAADDQLLDLRRALEDVVDLRVAVHPLDRELAGVAVAAED